MWYFRWGTQSCTTWKWVADVVLDVGVLDTQLSAQQQVRIIVVKCLFDQPGKSCGHLADMMNMWEIWLLSQCSLWFQRLLGKRLCEKEELCSGLCSNQHCLDAGLCVAEQYFKACYNISVNPGEIYHETLLARGKVRGKNLTLVILISSSSGCHTIHIPCCVHLWYSLALSKLKSKIHLTWQLSKQMVYTHIFYNMPQLNHLRG